MRPLSLTGKPAPNADINTKIDWVMRQLDLIAAHSREEGSSLADPYNVNAPATPLRTLDYSTATLSQVAQVLTTFLKDTQKRGLNHGLRG